MLLLLFAVGCATIAPTEYHRPAHAVDTVYRIGGEFEPNTGLAGEVIITIDDEEVIRGKLPALSTTAEFLGEYQGQDVLVELTKVRKIGSKYLRADVTIGNERAASLTF